VSLAARLIHRVAIVQLLAGDPEDPDDLDDHGHAETTTTVVTVVRALVQPRSVREMESISQAGLELSDHVVFMLPRQIPQDAWLADADESGILAGGRRFDVKGVRSFEFGRSPHLEIDVKSAGRTEGPAVGS
jgi:hypothetical protein